MPGSEPAPATGGAEPIGVVLARLRTGRGMSQLRLAELLCAASGQATVTRHEVSRWERAERVPSAYWLRWLAAVLEVPVGQLAEAARVARAGRSAGAVRMHTPLWTPLDAAALTRLLDAGGTDLTRLAHGWLAQPGNATRAPAAGPGPGAAPELDALAARLDDLRRTDDLVGGADLADIVLAELRAAVGLLRAHRPTRRLLGTVAGYAQLAGWTAADAGRPEVARRAYAVGLSAATAAGDRALGAHLLGCLSHLLAERDPTEALLLARTAYAGARHTGGGGLQALLLHRVAFAAALAGERRSSESALAAAERVADRLDRARERDWLYWLDTDELTALTGRCFAALGRPLRAEPLLRQRWDRTAAGPRPADRSRPARAGPRTLAIDGCWLAAAYLGRRRDRPGLHGRPARGAGRDPLGLTSRHRPGSRHAPAADRGRSGGSGGSGGIRARPGHRRGHRNRTGGPDLRRPGPCRRAVPPVSGRAGTGRADPAGRPGTCGRAADQQRLRSAA